VLRLTILRRSIEVIRDRPSNPPEHRTSRRSPAEVRGHSANRALRPDDRHEPDGDWRIYNFTLGKFDVGLPQKVTLGLGPLVAIPTSTSANFGTNKLQAGAAAPQSWGLPGVPGTYQQTLSGVSSHVTDAQPLIFFTGIALQLPPRFTNSWHLF
jgi:hypothetical protein